MEPHKQYNLNDGDEFNQGDGSIVTPNVMREDRDVNIKDFFIFDDREFINRKGQKFSVTTVASASVNTSVYSVAATEYLIALTSLVIAPIIGLPKPSLIGRGKTYIVKDQAGGATTTVITIQSVGEETIDGAANTTIAANYGSKRFYTDGISWYII